MDIIICADGNCLLPDLERRASTEETIIDFVFFTVISECTLVSGFLWDGISDSRLADYSANVDSDPRLHHPIPKSFQTSFGTHGSLFALGFFCYRAEFLDLVVELRGQEARYLKSEVGNMKFEKAKLKTFNFKRPPLNLKLSNFSLQPNLGKLNLYFIEINRMLITTDIEINRL